MKRICKTCLQEFEGKMANAILGIVSNLSEIEMKRMTREEVSEG